MARRRALRGFGGECREGLAGVSAGFRRDLVVGPPDHLAGVVRQSRPAELDFTVLFEEAFPAEQRPRLDLAVADDEGIR
jgi:hypothetical protein